MKLKYTPVLSLAVLFLLSPEMCSQEKIESNTLPQDPTLYDLVLFSELNILTPLKETRRSSSLDNVFIVQVGEGNSSNVTILAEESSLSLAQFGNENSTVIDVNVKNFEGNVVQNGNNNFSTNLVQNPNKDLRLEIHQNGNGNHFISHGTNSIGNKLMFDMSGDQTIIVRNYE